MSGTKAGGVKTVAKNLASDPNYYKRIGALGGVKSRTGGFAAGEDGKARARKYGAIGGKVSKRRKVSVL